jgi:hypothetical protein
MKLSAVKIDGKMKSPGKTPTAIQESGHFSTSGGFEIELEDGMVWITKDGETKGVSATKVQECTIARPAPAQQKKTV